MTTTLPPPSASLRYWLDQAEVSLRTVAPTGADGRLRVAIVGSRGYPVLSEVRHFVRSLRPASVVVSGGASGVDWVAVEEARALGIPWREYRAEWDKYGKSAGFRRNGTIVKDADVVVAFWDGESHGTPHTIDLAVRARVPVLLRQP